MRQPQSQYISVTYRAIPSWVEYAAYVIGLLLVRLLLLRPLWKALFGRKRVSKEKKITMTIEEYEALQATTKTKKKKKSDNEKEKKKPKKKKSDD
ncbi:MAG: hypothetical protein H6766_03060 [Candidatus Peribacteria bacterium]|nr:MAG: hypothetical protein H6766_03060 [Candidatus Peribacteria bacterium]